MMAEATSEHKKQARRAAAVVSACVIAFAAAFIALVLVLDHFAPSDAPSEIPIAQKASSKTFYVLLIGSDTRKGTALYTGKATDHAQVDQHSDVMTLMRVDPKKYAISFLSIPRDTVIDGETLKINNSLLDNDPLDVVDAVERLTGLRADYYMMTTFATFAELIDEIGGVDVDVPADVAVDDPVSGSRITLKAGAGQHLDGAHALALARARHEYGDNQDVIRQANVREVEAAIVKQVLELDDVEDVERLLGLVEDDIQTDFDLPTIGLDVMRFIQHSDEVTILQGSGPFEGGDLRESDGQWVIPEDADTWKKVMKAFKKGKDPTTVVSLPELSAISDGETAEEGSSESPASANSDTDAKSAKSASATKGKKS